MSSLALNTNFVKTMSSREIAELTGKEHKHVKRDCEIMFEELGLAPEGYAQNWTHPQNGQVYVEYLLTRELVQTLITGYNIKLRHAVIHRLNELEAQTSKPVANIYDTLKDPTQMRGYLLHYVEQVIALEAENQSMKVDVKALEIIAKADGSLCMRDAANNLQVRQNELKRFLIANAWIYKRNGNDAWHGYSDKIQAGYLEHKSTIVKASDGVTDKITEQVRITPKGLTKLAKIFAKGEAA